MKILSRNLNILLFSILLLTIKGDKIFINLKSNFPINQVVVNPKKENIKNNFQNLTSVEFTLESKEGKQILLDIYSKYKNVCIKNLNFSLRFEKGNSYFYNEKNISIIKKNPFKILIKFHIPYKIYCSSHNDIILKDSNSVINFNLSSNVFKKNNKNKKLKINITDIYWNNNNTSKYPIMNFKKSKTYGLNKIYKINFKNKNVSNNTLIIKYKVLDYKTKEQSIKECSVKIKNINKRKLQGPEGSTEGASTGSGTTTGGSSESTNTTNNEYYYIFGEIFDNEEAYENMDDIVEFLNNDINVFDINEDFFQDICYHYEREMHDYVLDDRIEFFYQNYSLCGEGDNINCNLSQIYFENFSFCCICLPVVQTEESTHKKKEHSMELDESFSMEGVSEAMGNLFFESNLSVIQCFFVLLKENIILNNYGVLITGILLFIQILASFFLCSHMNDIRLYVFRDLIKCKYNPPLKRGKTISQPEENLVSESTNLKRINSKNTKSIIITNTTQKKYEKTKKVGTELASIKGMVPINANNKEIKEIMSNINHSNNLNVHKINKNSRKLNIKRFNNYNEPSSNIRLKDSTVSSRKYIKNNGILSSNDNFTENNTISVEIYRKKTKRDNEEEGDDNIESNNPDNISEFNNKEYDIVKSEKNNPNFTNNFERTEKDKDLVYPYEKKDYDDDDLNGLDYDECLVYDKRTFCQLFHKQLLERQLIANTFCVKEHLKPFSIKLIVLIFNIACYLVVNGFLFNEEYVMKILRRTSKGFYYFIVDSTTRIVYSSIIGGIINIIVGLLFRADKALRKVQAKYKDNPIILHGEIVKIYKSTRNLYIIFAIFNVCIMLVFIFYLFCFCGVYRNCQLDWFEGCFIVIFLTQLVPVFVSLLLAFLRKAGLNCKIECLFKVSSWIIENL